MNAITKAIDYVRGVFLPSVDEPHPIAPPPRRATQNLILTLADWRTVYAELDNQGFTSELREITKQCQKKHEPTTVTLPNAWMLALSMTGPVGEEMRNQVRAQMGPVW